MSKNAKPAPAKVADPEDARAEVERLNGQELQLAMLYRQKAVELAGVRAERGDQVLAAADPAGAARVAGQRVSTLLEELESLADASKRARERRLAAIPAVFEAEASEKERQADRLEAEAKKLEAESNRLRDALEQHDEWAWLPAEGKVDGRYFPIVPYGDGQARVVDARGPIFRRRRNDAQALRQQAAQHRLKQPAQAGMLEANTVETLFAAVHSDAMRVGPPIDAIVTWAEQAIEKEKRRRSRIASTEDTFVSVDAPMTLHLEWRNGAIDQAQSHVIPPEPIDHVIQRPTAKPAAAPAANVSRRPESDRSPFDTSARPHEIAREVANTGQTIEEVAKAWGVPVPKPAQVEAD